MYNDDVKDLRKQKRKYNFEMLREFISIYLKLLLTMPNEKNVRNKFVGAIKEWFIYNKRETEILNYIYEKYGKIEDDENVDEVLEILDEIFENMFDYYDDILDGYEDMLELKQVYRSNFSEPDFTILTEETTRNLIKKMVR